MLQDLIPRQLGVEAHPHALWTLRKNRGFSSQTARFVSDHLNEAQRLAWRQTRWPKRLGQARQKKALLLCGEAASVAQGGSVSSPWAPQGQQPAVPTSGTRKVYQVFGLIASFSGRVFSKAHAGRFHAAS